MELVVASRNHHKLEELGRLLSPHRLDPLPAEVRLPPEDGGTFLANARLKARAAARATGRPAVADDSGIEAAALGGAPGVRSARFAGDGARDEDNLRRLLAEVPVDGDRRVAYVCSLVLCRPTASGALEERHVEGRCDGLLASEPRGTGGFGYDPAFLPADVADGRTMAELTAEEKDAISHRGRAARALLGLLAAEGPVRP